MSMADRDGFIWFDGEEAVCKEWDECGRPGAPDNTYGSRYYVEAARKANAFTSIKTMILLDMVGPQVGMAFAQIEHQPFARDTERGVAQRPPRSSAEPVAEKSSGYKSLSEFAREPLASAEAQIGRAHV